MTINVRAVEREAAKKVGTGPAIGLTEIETETENDAENGTVMDAIEAIDARGQGVTPVIVTAMTGTDVARETSWTT